MKHSFYVFGFVETGSYHEVHLHYQWRWKYIFSFLPSFSLNVCQPFVIFERLFWVRVRKVGIPLYFMLIYFKVVFPYHTWLVCTHNIGQTVKKQTEISRSLPLKCLDKTWTTKTTWYYFWFSWIITFSSCIIILSIILWKKVFLYQ